MDKQLLKKSVESIEMPEDMKDRIIRNCRSGEAKPLFLPKKRFVYMPMAVTACACVLVAALAGVGIWQLKVLSEEPPALTSEDSGTVDAQQDVIHVITLEQEDIPNETISLPDSDRVQMSGEQLCEYYGMDLSVLSSLTAIPEDMHYLHYEWERDPLFYVNGGKEGDIFTDTYIDDWSVLYSNADADDEIPPANLRNITIGLSKLEILRLEKLWEDPEMLSTIGGRQMAIGCLDVEGGVKIYFAQFTSEDGSINFLVEGYSIELEEMLACLADVVEQTKTQDYQPAQTHKQLTLDTLIEIYKNDPSALSWSDFEQYESAEIGSGLYILQYIIEDRYTLVIGGVPYEEPWYIHFAIIGEDDFIEDIREGGLEEYIASHPVKEPLTLDKFREVLSNCAKIGWSDFEQFEGTAYGSTPWYIEYDIEGKYTLTIVGDPRNPPEAVLFHVNGQYYSLDLKKDINKLDEYIYQVIPYGDVINTIPLQEDGINYFMSPGDGEPVYMTDEQLSEYYGIDVTTFGGIPSYMEAESYTYNDGKRYIWRKDDGSNICYDKNTFSFSNPDGTECIEISLGRLMGHNDKLWEEQEQRSRIDDRTVVIGKTEADHYIAEFFSADREISILVSAYGGVSFDELYDVISALVHQTEYRYYRHYYGEYGEDSGNDLNFIHAIYSEDKSDDLWWSLNGQGYPDEPYIQLLDEDFTAMSKEELKEYYGVNIFPNMPAAVTLSTPNGVKGPGVYKQNSGTGEVYFDTNSFWYSGWTSNNIRIDVAKDTLPYRTDMINALTTDASSLSYVNGHPVLFMYDNYGCEYAIFMTASKKAGFRIAMADIGFGGVYTTDLIDIVSQLIEQ